MLLFVNFCLKGGCKCTPLQLPAYGPGYKTWSVVDLQLPGKLESQAHFAPSIMAQQFPMSPQTNPAAFATLIPVAPQGTILAEQMKAMTISGTKYYMWMSIHSSKQFSVLYNQVFSPCEKFSPPALIGVNKLP